MFGFFRNRSLLLELLRSIQLLIIAENQTMATLQDLKDAIAAKDTEIKAKLTDLEAQLVHASGPTAAELDAIKAGIESIGVASPAPAPAATPSPASNQAA